MSRGACDAQVAERPPRTSRRRTGIHQQRPRQGGGLRRRSEPAQLPGHSSNECGRPAGVWRRCRGSSRNRLGCSAQCRVGTGRSSAAPLTEGHRRETQGRLNTGVVAQAQPCRTGLIDEMVDRGAQVVATPLQREAPPGAQPRNVKYRHQTSLGNAIDQLGERARLAGVEWPSGNRDGTIRKWPGRPAGRAR